MINHRKSHVKRCFGVTKTGDTLEENTDSYLDILRTDEFVYTDSDGQGWRFLIKWSDDTLKEWEDDYDTKADQKDRKTEMGKATDPELPYEKDPTDFIPFRVINRLTIKDSDGQGVKYVFKNKNQTDEGERIPTTRELFLPRLYHWDVTKDDELNSTDPSATHIILDEDYHYVEDSKDKEQYFDMEVIKHWTHFLHTARITGIAGQGEKVVLQNKDMYMDMLGIDVTLDENISPGSNSAGEITIAARMDPFQNIINVQWGGLAVEFGDTDKDAPDPEKPTP